MLMALTPRNLKGSFTKGQAMLLARELKSLLGQGTQLLAVTKELGPSGQRPYRYCLRLLTEMELRQIEGSVLASYNLGGISRDFTLGRASEYIYSLVDYGVKELRSAGKLGFKHTDLQEGDIIKWWLYTLTVKEVGLDYIILQDNDGVDKRMDVRYFLNYYSHVKQYAGA